MSPSTLPASGSRSKSPAAPPEFPSSARTASDAHQPAILDDLFRGFSRAYQNGFAEVKPHWPQLATMIPSSTRENSMPGSASSRSCGNGSARASTRRWRRTATRS
ncbi:MAG: Mu-like prophage major head subunit gpT family protein [Alphaproteobacteria bacterium]|nr:Mu-like prophage major head subunit gpT family protein [Alphaproteobacteria bacterium]